MAEAACANLSGRLETEVTSRFISCSMLSFFSAAADALESGCWANPGSAKQARPNVRSIAVAVATVLGSDIGPPGGCYDCAPGRAAGESSTSLTLVLHSLVGPGRRSRRSIPAQVAVLVGSRGDPCHLDRRRLLAVGKGSGHKMQILWGSARAFLRHRRAASRHGRSSGGGGRAW